MFNHDLILECEKIKDVLSKNFPKHIDGKEAILELKKANYNWKQMEWIGWFIEYKLFKIITENLGGSIGLRYGNTTFDYQNKFTWDFKAHPILKPNGSNNQPLILNDQESIENCVNNNYGIGYIIVNGYANFESSDEFKIWHDSLKGGISEYEKERVKRGAKSRKRKTSFDLQNIEFFFFINQDDFNEGLSEKWMTLFQKNMRNANGTPRRAKYALRTDKIPPYFKPISDLRFDVNG